MKHYLWYYEGAVDSFERRPQFRSRHLERAWDAARRCLTRMSVPPVRSIRNDRHLRANHVKKGGCQTPCAQNRAVARFY